MADRNIALANVVTFVLALTLAVQPANAVTIVFQDDFEDIAVGDYPDEHAWLNLLGGRTAYVSDEVANSGTRSFRLESHSSSARVDYVSLGEIPYMLGCEVSILPDPKPRRRTNAGFVEAFGDSCV